MNGLIVLGSGIKLNRLTIQRTQTIAYTKMEIPIVSHKKTTHD